MRVCPSLLILAASVAAGCLWAPLAGASPFYDYDVIARDTPGALYIDSPASINDRGEVAFVAEAPTTRVFRWNPLSGLVAVSMIEGSTLPIFRTPQMLNDGRVVSSMWRNESVLNDFPRVSLYGPAASTENAFAQFSSGDVAHVSANNLGNAVFQYTATRAPGVQNQIAIFYHNASAGKNDLVQIANFTGDPNVTDLAYFPRISDDDTTVMRSGDTATAPITAYKSNGPQVIASTAMGFDSLGQQPGISDDGSVLAFWGSLTSAGATTLKTTPGPGVFACTREGPNFSQPFRVTGGVNATNVPRADLGHDTNGNPLYFSAYDVNAPVGVCHLHTGTTSSLDGDSFTVCFIASPNAASRSNPGLPGQSLLFSQQPGLWTVRVDIDKQLSLPNARVYHPWGAVPVAQVGDVIGGATLGDLHLWDPIARVSTDKVESPRTERRMDHQLVFVSNTDKGRIIVRARYLDSDEDGLPDHWERPGGGIDMDGDGVVDLDLPSMGADPFKRDLFLQVDWLDKHASLGDPVDDQPAPGSIKALVDMFAKAPALPNGIPAGISLHVDAGFEWDKGKGSLRQPFTQNMGRATPFVEGGNLIPPVDVVYLGAPGSVTATGVTTRSLQEIKDAFFLKEDKGARELAFRYAVLGDFRQFYPETGTPASGTVQSYDTTTDTLKLDFAYPGGLTGAVKIVGGPSAGQVRFFWLATGSPTNVLHITDPFTTAPTSASTYVLLSDSSGQAEYFGQPPPDNTWLPGNDIVVSVGAWGVNLGGYLANTCITWRALAHELGHTLGLRHGGIDGTNNKTNYKSLMNYAYQLVCKSPVQSYSGPGDATFVDWYNLKPEFHVTPLPLGVTPAEGKGGFGDSPQPSEVEATVADYMQVNGRFPDVTPPTVSIVSPAAGAVVSLSAPLTINVSAADDQCLDQVFVEFDANGDGVFGPDELVAAMDLGGGIYQAAFTSVTGASGNRLVNAYAVDCGGTSAESTVTVGVGSVITGVSVSPVLFDPAIRACAITATGGVGLQPEARIRDANFVYVRTVPLSAGLAGVYTGAWDGRSAANTVVSAGAYTVEVWNGQANTRYAPTAAVKVVTGTRFWRVNAAAPGPAHDGTSWTSAFLRVQDGINAAVSGDEVWVAAGVYTERVNLKNEVGLYGGFNGSETAREQRDFRANATVLDGAQGGSVVSVGISPTVATVFDGFTVRNGGRPNYGTSQGGGIYIAMGASATISNNLISGNRAAAGAGLYAGSGAPLIANNTFADNATSGQGGGLYIATSTGTVMNNVVVRNAALAGGGAYVLAGTPLLLNNTFASNLGIVNGGGVACDNTTAALVNNIVSANSSGIFRTGTGTPSFTANCVWDNPAYAYTGIADPTGASGNVESDPQLALPAFGNTHIQPTSICVDAGAPGYDAGSFDTDGQPRLRNGSVDIGADESDGTTWPATHPVVRVSPAGSDANDGSSWALAKRTLQAGLTALVAGGELWVQAGTYTERITVSGFDYLYGGFAGTETDRAQRNPSANATILDGGAGGSVVTISAPGFRLETVDNFTIRNGNSGTVQGATGGGGVYCRDSAPAFVNCTVTANNVTVFGGFGGGGALAYYAAPSFTNCTITANTTNTTGGGVSGFNAAVAFSGCTITGNTSNGVGGGVYGSKSALAFSGGSVSENTAGGNLPSGIYCDSGVSLSCSGVSITGNQGDGIVSVQSPTTIAACTINGQVGGRGIYLLSCPSISVTGNNIWGNQGSTRGPGGGISVSNTTGGSVLWNLIFSNAAQNNAQTFGSPQYPAQAGGGIYVDSPVTIANNAIYGNLANGGGGGVYCALSSPSLVNNTIAYNNAVTGGGVCVGAGNPALTNDIIAFNSSGVSVTGGTPLLNNDCVYGNTSGLGTDYSGIADPTGTNGNIAADPMLASVLTGDVRLEPASTCRDAGDSTAVQTGWVDVYGQARVQGSAVDIGAAESPGAYVPPPTPAVVFVRPAGSDANSGTSWALAKRTIAGALSAAEPGNEIWVAAGIYPESITLKDGVALLGGFNGSETVKAQRDALVNVTILDGGGNGSVVTAPANCLPATVVDGFTIRNGTGTTPSGANSSYGGGIYGAYASPTIANCTLSGNTADVGAGIYISHGAPLILNLTATGNTSTGNQAAVQFRNAMAYMTGGTVSGNSSSGISLDGSGRLYASAVTVTDNAGGGISVANASAAIVSCSVLRQTGGSGVTLSRCPLATVTGCTVSGNTGANLGAGITLDSNVSGFIGGNTITGNVSSAQGGGLMVLNNAALIVANNVFQANIAETSGGGLFISSGACQLTNNTLTQNASTNGGGITVSGGTPALANNIIAFNTSGLYVTAGTVSLKNNDIVGNTGNLGYNVAGLADPTGTSGNISADPAFANIAVGNLRIQGASPCVDAGDPGSVPPGGLDVYGQPRVQGARVDIGAAESDGTVYPPPVARVLYVSKSGSDANTGLSWAQAKRSVGAAMAMALPGDEVWTAAGTYAEHVTLASGSALYGGFAGGETQRSARDVGKNPTILDGGGTGSVVTFPLGALPSTAVDGLTIRNGAGSPVSGYGGDAGGGGVWAVDTAGTIANCTVTGNNATYGSGVFAWDANLTISASTISQNQREGVAVWGGSVSLTGLTVGSNAYDGVSVSNTGAVSVTGCQVTANGHIGISATGGSIAVTGSTIANQAAYGGLSLSNCARVLVQGCTIRGNAGAPSGGGIYLSYAGTASVLGNTITGNTSIGDGGGLWVNQGAVVSNNLIANNGASGSGGGIFCDGTGNGSPSLVNNTLTGNASVGGALHVNGGAPTIANNIVYANSSGIRVASGTPAFLNNCVFGNDVANYIGIADQTGLNGDLSADPLVLTTGPQAGRIQAGSPCVDAGNGSAVAAGWTDIDGQARVQGAMVDIGADESDGAMYVPVNPPVVYVRTAGSDTNDGSTWALAKKTIGAALTAAQADGEIWAAAGTYTENLTLKDRVSLFGGFAGSETLKSQRNWTANATILDGGATGSVALFAPGPMRAARIDGFTLRNGSGTQSGTSKRGGAVSITDAALTLANCTITGNTASGSGGGVAATASSLAVINGVVTGNTAGSDFYNYGGGGLYAEGTTLGVTGGSYTANQVTGTTLEGSAICGVNNATVLVAGASLTGNLGFAATVQTRFGSSLSVTGGTISNNASRGVSVGEGSARITGCTIANNGSNGVYLLDCPSATIQGCRITGNQTGLYISSGSAPYNIYTTGLIADNVIANNTMPPSPNLGGGGLFLASSQRLVSNLIYGNTSSTNGGGIYIPSGSPQIVNNTIVSNTSAAGGGITLASGTPVVVNNIIASNSSGVAVQGGTLTLRNNDAFSNTGGNYSGVTDPTGSNGNISADPLFVNRAGGDYHLLAPSPCINIGDDTVVVQGDTDFDGAVRISGAHVDIGAFEYGSVVPFTFTDAVHALRIAGGVQAASSPDLQRLDIIHTSPSNGRIDLLDAASLARKAAGLDPNP